MKYIIFFRRTLYLCVLWLVASCVGDPPISYCKSHGDLSAVCGLQAPEDLEWLPDRSAILISEYGHLGDIEGRISLYKPDTGDTTVLYSSEQPRVNIAGRLWGDTDCSEPDFFSPHGFHLSQRPSGRWQLLVVNHRVAGEEPLDSIEMFELKRLQDHWYLEWRGCVEAESDTLLNDVVAAPRGFFTTKMAPTASTAAAILDVILRRQSAAVLRWDMSSGWQNWKDIRGSMFNGIEWHRDSGLLFVSEWAKDRVNIYNRNGELSYQVDIEKPDNISYDPASERYYVTGQRGSNWSLARCVARQADYCEIGFEVKAIGLRELLADDPNAVKSVYVSDGVYFGAGTVSIVSKEALFVGSFNGNRLLKVNEGADSFDVSAL